ncbi:MAG: AAA family ATPase, partial [Paramuribaculum sp.]|nr:AAA family ATPase [Paramuribaculum sp.]
MATKVKTVWFCSECGADSPKWQGRCPSCGAWNSMIEEKVNAKASKSVTLSSRSLSRPQPVSQIEIVQEPRIKMPSKELNRVLGGGLVAGSLVLIGGEPGIGKSTLVLQNTLSIRSKRILYVSGEESATQIKMRAERIGRVCDNVLIACETSLENIMTPLKNVTPESVVIASLQTIASDEIESAAGTVSQVRECSATL